MGAPLMLSNKNRSQSLENNLADEHFDMLDTTEREPAVNGKLDIDIKDNSIRDKSENKAHFHSMNDLKHNYH